MLTSPQLLLSVLAITTLYYIYTNISVSLRRWRFATKHSCQPVRHARNLDPFLGLDQFSKVLKAVSQHRFLEYLQKEHFDKYGPTVERSIMGISIIFSNEPENLHAALVTRFDDFELGPRRRGPTREFGGIGVLNTDGKQWEHARALARPNFARKKFDRDLFERHVQTWFGGLPEDETPFDWQEWAFRFVSYVAPTVMVT
jgi:cytochrome P450